MSIWKFFGKKEEAAGRRSPRIRLLLADGARVETADGAYPLLNISESGVGVLVEDGEAPKGFEGTLFLGAETLPIRLEVVRCAGSFVGARFLGDMSAVRAALNRLFKEELRATEMSEVKAEAKEEEGIPRWFYAPGNYELFYLEHNSQPVRLEMEWNGRVVAAVKGESPRAGTISQADREKPSHSKSALIQWQGELSEEDRTKAIRILENVPGLEPGIRGALVAMLRR